MLNVSKSVKLNGNALAGGQNGKKELKGKRRGWVLLLAAMAAVPALASTTQAATIWWDGGAGDGLWAAGGNWSSIAGGDGGSGSVPLAADDLVFNNTSNNANQSINLGANRTANSITFQSGGTVLLQNNTLNVTGTSGILSSGSGAVTISSALNSSSGGITLNSGAGALTVSSATLTANQTWTNNSSSTLTASSLTTGNFGLTLAGTGSFVLGSVTTSNNAGSFVDLNGRNQTIADLILSTGANGGNIIGRAAAGAVASGTLTLAPTAARTFSGGIRNGDANYTLNLVKTGTFTQTLSGTNNNYSGTTTVENGHASNSSLTITGALTATSAVTVRNALLTLSNAANNALNNSAGITLGGVNFGGGRLSTTTTETIGAITPAVGYSTVTAAASTTLTFNGFGTRQTGAILVFGTTGTINNFSGTTNAVGPIWAISGVITSGIDFAKYDGSNNIVALNAASVVGGEAGLGGGDYFLPNATYTLSASRSARTLRTTGNVTVNTGTHNLTVGAIIHDVNGQNVFYNGNGKVIAVNDELLLLARQNPVTVNAQITGSTGTNNAIITTAGNTAGSGGGATLGNANNLISDIYINGGNLISSVNGALGSNSTSNTIYIHTGALSFAANTTQTVGKSIVVGSSGGTLSAVTNDSAGVPLLATLSGNATLHGTFTITPQGGVLAASGGTIDDGGLNQQFVLSGNYSGAGTLTVGGSAIALTRFARVHLTGNNSYTGGTTLSQAASVAIGVGHDNAFGTGAVTISGANMLEALGGTRTIANAFNYNSDFSIRGTNNFVFTGSVTLGAARTVSTVGTGSTTISGAIGSGTNNFTLTKSGSGFLAANGTVNAPVVVAAGTFGGTGTVNGLVTVNSGGRLSPGNSPGIQNYNAGLTFSSGSNYDWEHNAGNAFGTAGTNFDVANITGGSLTVTSGANLNLLFASGTNFSNSFWDNNQTWDIVTGGTSGSNFFGTSNIFVFINGVPQGTSNAISGQGNFSTAVSGSNLVLTWTASGGSTPTPTIAITTAAGTRALASSSVGIAGTYGNTGSGDLNAASLANLAGQNLNSSSFSPSGTFNVLAGSTGNAWTGSLANVGTTLGSRTYGVQISDGSNTATANSTVTVVGSRTINDPLTKDLGRVLVGTTISTTTNLTTYTYGNSATGALSDTETAGLVGSGSAGNGLSIAVNQATINSSTGVSGTLTGTISGLGVVNGSLTVNATREFSGTQNVVFGYTASVVNQRTFSTSVDPIDLGRFKVGTTPTGSTAISSSGLNSVTANATINSFTGGPSALTLATGDSTNFLGAAASQTANYTIGGTVATAGAVSGTFTATVTAELGSIASLTVGVNGTAVDARTYSTPNPTVDVSGLLAGTSFSAATGTIISSSEADGVATRETIGSINQTNSGYTLTSTGAVFAGSNSVSGTISGTTSYAGGTGSYSTTPTNNESFSHSPAAVNFNVTVGAAGLATADRQNSQAIFGTALTGSVAVNGNYAGIASKAEYNGAGTQTRLGSEAILLLGSNVTGGTETLNMAWRARTVSESDISLPTQKLYSDVVRLTGMDKFGGASDSRRSETDVFALQMNYVYTGPNESSLKLGWLDNGDGSYATTGDNQWVLATIGNFGVGGSAVFGYVNDFDGAGGNAAGSWANFVAEFGINNGNLSNYLGSYGVDTTNNVVWAVLNHNSDFAVIPEPTSLALLGLGAVGLLARRRRA